MFTLLGGNSGIGKETVKVCHLQEVRVYVDPDSD